MADHIADLMQNGALRLVAFVRNNPLRKHLVQSGIPVKDARIVEFSAGAEVSIVVTQDIDLFEPQKKGCQSKERHKIIHERKGKICKMIEKELKIYIVCCCRVEEFLPQN
ncbi:hypothetical protein ACFSQT_09835 [Mesorhizobium calcicola]|uniref:DUF5615 domain-containing protein n=1 Tax=Mesorhizobium calcicola TaxID=1300310 RepID=A0ABW4WDD7_9HYPH